MEFVLDEALLHSVRPAVATSVREEVGADVAVDVDVDVDVDCSPVFSGRLLSANELRAMAILEAVHSRARLQEQCYRLCGHLFHLRPSHPNPFENMSSFEIQCFYKIPHPIVNEFDLLALEP